MAKAVGLKCVKCGEVYPISAGPFVCQQCGERVVGPVRIVEGLLEVVYDYDKNPLTKEIVESRADRTIWKFRELLPVDDSKNIVSLGEGGTPLHRCRNLQSLWGAKNLYLKNESMNPVGSFKDRETSVMLSMAKQLGVKTVTIASSGNAGGAVAAYSNAARIKAVCFVPVSFNPSGKRSTYAAFNPNRLIAVRGFYEDVNNVSIEMGRKHGWYLTNHGFNPYRMEGDKTTAYETCMDLGWQVPDAVIIPTGSGGDVSGQWKAYKEMYDFGWIKSLPRMIAAPMSAGAPLVEAILNNRPNLEPILDAGDSIADGIISKWDDYAPLLLPAIRDSKGTAVAATDEETMEAEKLLAQQEGIFLEPSSACAIAGYKKLLDQGDVDKEEVVVIIGTATGLKNPKVANRFEASTMAYGLAPSLAKAVESLNTIGIERIAKHNKALADMLVEGFQERGGIASPQRDEERSSIISVRFPGRDAASIAKRLNAAKVVVSARGDVIRFSPHLYNTEEDIERVFEVMEKIIGIDNV